jgi:hypothetical protein
VFRHCSKLFAPLLAFACGSTLRTPPAGQHPENARQVVVEYPPPPARVERVPADPGDACVWVDGYWEWLGRRWEWQIGNWVVPPPGCQYAAPRLAWIDSARGGVLYFTPPGWYANEGDEAERSARKVACKPVICTAPKNGESAGDERSGDGG